MEETLLGTTRLDLPLFKREKEKEVQKGAAKALLAPAPLSPIVVIVSYFRLVTRTLTSVGDRKKRLVIVNYFFRSITRFLARPPYCLVSSDGYAIEVPRTPPYSYTTGVCSLLFRQSLMTLIVQT